MTAFWITAAVLVAIVVAVVVRPLLSRNVPAAAGAGEMPWPVLAGTLVAAVPSLAILLYLHFGNPIALWRGDDFVHVHEEPSTAQVEGMVNQLAQRLKTEGGDASGWAMLGRSYAALERYADAAAAYAKAVELSPASATWRADYADVLATLGGGTVNGPPYEQVKLALALDPGQPKALALAAGAALERGELPEAIAQWEHLLRTLPPGSPAAARTEANLAQARARLQERRSATRVSAGSGR
jgi:cytochrome c-type biogenesis protein CcmH